MEDEWRRFKAAIYEEGEEVCGTRKTREGKRRKGSEWWSEEIRRVVERKSVSNMEEDKERGRFG